MRPALPVLLVLIANSGCVLPGDATGTTGIHGQALIGPTCPVEKNPPEPGCEDQPYSGKLAVMSDDLSRVIKEFETEANGTFRVPVPPGHYEIRQAPAPGHAPQCGTNETVSVTADYTWVTVHCDSGIR